MASRTSSGSSSREKTSPCSESVFATVLTAIFLTEQPVTASAAPTRRAINRQSVKRIGICSFVNTVREDAHHVARGSTVHRPQSDDRSRRHRGTQKADVIAGPCRLSVVG